MTRNPRHDLHSPEMERALVACALVDGGVYDVTHIQPGDFYLKLHAQVWRAIGELRAAGEFVDFVTVRDALAAAQSGVTETELAHIAAFDDVNFVHYETYANSVREYAHRRSILALAEKAARLALNSNGSYADDLAALRDQFAAAVGRLAAQTPAAAEAARAAALAAALAAATWADMAKLIGPVQWEWPDWLPSALLVELVADSGAGKSAVALRIAAVFLAGWMWPDGTPYSGATGKVLWCETEAGQALNLERAQTWGLPIENILSPLPNPLDDVSLFDPAHLEAIAAKAARDDVRLIIVDSLSGGTAGREKGEDQMPVVKWLSELARDLKKPVILLHHLRKRGLADGIGKDTVTLDRVRGSTVIVQPARVVWALDVPNPNTFDTKRLSVIKSNLGRFPKPIGVRIDDEGLAFGEAPKPPTAMSKLDQAKLLLLRLLAGGPRLQTDIEAEAISEDISMDTMREAKARLGCRVNKDGHTGRWSWDLPDTAGGQDRQDRDA